MTIFLWVTFFIALAFVGAGTIFTLQQQGEMQIAEQEEVILLAAPRPTPKIAATPRPTRKLAAPIQREPPRPQQRNTPRKALRHPTQDRATALLARRGLWDD